MVNKLLLLFPQGEFAVVKDCPFSHAGFGLACRTAEIDFVGAVFSLCHSLSTFLAVDDCRQNSFFAKVFHLGFPIV